MTTTAQTKREERTRIMHDIYDNKIPTRVPINLSFSLPVFAEYGNVDKKSAYWDATLMKDAIDKMSSVIPSDTCLYWGSVYTPVSSQTLNSINKVMSDTGYMQHPNTQCMEEDEYDELIADPYKFIIDKCIPRVYKNLNASESNGRHIFALAQELLLKQSVATKEWPMIEELNEKYGYYQGEYGGFGRAPMDWLGDQLRSFTGICSDVRRHRDKLIEALDSIYPLLYKIGLQPDLNNVNRYATTGFQLHMATYLREKDFAQVWLPTWKRQVEDYASLGMRTEAFLEHDWTRLLDYLVDLPTGSVFSFEFTDAKMLKEKLGKKHILSSGFPLGYLTSCSKAEIIDKTKEWLDIMAPDGQYIFGFDKGALALSDINLENLIAVCETVLEYGQYENAGAACGEIFNKNDYTHSNVPEFKSEYLMTWDDYKNKYPNTPENARELIMSSEENMFKTLFTMTC